MSGEITITPGRQFAPGELETRAGLNQLGTPTGRVNEQSIGTRELMAEQLRALLDKRGTNLLCNGGFDLWDYATSLSGVVSGGRKHDYGSANRWVTPNDANRVVSRIQNKFSGPSDLDFRIYIMQYQQNAAIDVSITPAYVGQRLEEVSRLDEKVVTFSIWLHSAADMNVTPQIRQNFGASGSADVVTDSPGGAVALAANTWQQVTATWTIPSVAGKTIGNDNFTEFRIVVPQSSTFTLLLARAQVELGQDATGFDLRGLHQDILFAGRYYEKIAIQLTTSITAFLPFVNWRFTKRVSTYTTTLVPVSGTGATIASFSVPAGNGVYQNANHSAAVAASVICDAELHAPA